MVWAEVWEVYFGTVVQISGTNHACCSNKIPDKNKNILENEKKYVGETLENTRSVFLLVFFFRICDF